AAPGSRNGRPSWRDQLRLGGQLFTGAAQRRALDHVFCLAPFEVEIERWLGAKSVSWLPRTIERDKALSWAPFPGRMGFVGTLDHPPNRDGLLLFLDALTEIAPPHVKVRVVGSPLDRGYELAQRY